MREISEGRMRADARGGGPVPVPSEGRIRAAGQVFLAAALGNCLLFFFRVVFPLVTGVVVADLCLCLVKLG